LLYIGHDAIDSGTGCGIILGSHGQSSCDWLGLEPDLGCTPLQACYSCVSVIILRYRINKSIILFVFVKLFRFAMNSKQCKMARAGLGWTVQTLADAAEVRPATISSFERKGTAQASTIKVIEQALLSTNRVRFEGSDGVCIVDD
jgi:DNA-binding XRE family transcriptional regulator